MKYLVIVSLFLLFGCCPQKEHKYPKYQKGDCITFKVNHFYEKQCPNPIYEIVRYYTLYSEEIIYSLYPANLYTVENCSFPSISEEDVIKLDKCPEREQ